VTGRAIAGEQGNNYWLLTADYGLMTTDY